MKELSTYDPDTAIIQASTFATTSRTLRSTLAGAISPMPRTLEAAMNTPKSTAVLTTPIAAKVLALRIRASRERNAPDRAPLQRRTGEDVVMAVGITRRERGAERSWVEDSASQIGYE